MPRRKFIDKRTATTFSLVHRAQNDPLLHDENAPSMVFVEKSAPSRPAALEDDGDSLYSHEAPLSDRQASQRKQHGDLEEEFGLGVRPNEGEAAQHGVFYDDTAYDYMQHMRDLGGAGGPVTWVESSAPPEKKGKKLGLADALRDMDLASTRSSVRGSTAGDSVASSTRSLLPEEVLPSEFVMRRSYQDMQDVPDEIAGLQPDMDPRLREVLEALDDEAYVDNEDDIFGELTKEGHEVERDEWELMGEQQVFDDEDDAGWESDDTVRAATPPPAAPPPTMQLPPGEPAAPPEDVQAPPPVDPTEGAWLDEFNKFKQDAKAKATAPINADSPVRPAPPTARSATVQSSLASGPHKKRKGAKTSKDTFSMTSSSLLRTEHQTILDARFDKVLQRQAALDSISEASSQAPSTVSRDSAATGVSRFSGMSSYSQATDSEAPQLERADFGSIISEFLEGHSKAGKRGRYVKKFGPQTGMQQLDEVRSGLGPARVGPKSGQSVLKQ
ncbi:Protein ltv1 [Teratosphaeriaceae sp. CCFEE 6253]|nr:Protein ltv1 [Teratosphaeriaceae sp. CCFEE 6253]